MGPLSLLLLLAAPAAAVPIYDIDFGEAPARPAAQADKRRDLHGVSDARHRKLAESTVALFRDGGTYQRAGDVFLPRETHGANLDLCKDEPFADQPAGAMCSGFLVGPDLVATAGHCFETVVDCARTLFVFGFSVQKAGDPKVVVPASDVYLCAELVRWSPPDPGPDWALVRLDRPAAGRAPLELAADDRVAGGTPLLVIGHPSGLPTKVADGGFARDSGDPDAFTASLDTYQGNSGSAVFNAADLKVEGILVSGAADFTPAPDKPLAEGACRRSIVCPRDGCEGETITKIGVLKPALAEAAAARLKKPAAAAGAARRVEGKGEPDFDGSRKR